MSDHGVKFFEDKPQLFTEKDNVKNPQKTRKKLTCKNYGLECNFTTSKDTIESIIREFKEHSIQEHYADYPEGILKKSLL